MSRFPARTVPCVDCGVVTFFAANNRNSLCRACGLKRRGNQKREVSMSDAELERAMAAILRREVQPHWERP